MLPEPFAGRSLMRQHAPLIEARGPGKLPVRQAFRGRNLRNKQGERNAARKLCTAKQLFPPAPRFITLDSRNRGAIQPFTPVAHNARAEAAHQRANRNQAAHFRRISIMTRVDQSRMANAIRALAMDAVEKAKSGHPGLPMGAADVATVLFTQFLKFDAADPRLARPRPLHPLGRPRLDAAVCAAVPHRKRGHDDRADREFPAAWFQDPGTSGEFHHLRRRDHHRPARPGRRLLGRLGAGRAAAGGGVRRGYRRSLHLCAVLRRRSDGRRQP